MTTYETFLKKASRASVVPVVETMPADLLTPLACYLKLSAGEDVSFLLESVEGGTSLARYSFVGAAPDRVEWIGSLKELREHFSSRVAEADTELPPFIGGAIGFIGFESCDGAGSTLKMDAVEGACFMFYRSIVAFDHARQVVNIISLAFTEDRETELRSHYDDAVERNLRIRSTLEIGHFAAPDIAGAASAGELISNWTRPEFEGAVARIQELIRAGECYQVVLSQCFTKPTDASAVSIYRALRSLNPSPYMFLIQLDGKAIVGASPEMLVRCVGDRLEYRPIAGTRPRGSTDVADAALAEEMALDEKEVAEHLMLVDLGRNDLGRVAEYGTVEVATLMKVEKYSHVQHLVSSLRARLGEGFDRFDALAACFPAGTVSGAPKVRAIQIIRDLEPDKRGLYAGTVGYFDYSGNMDTCIAIRTLVLEDGVVRIQAGAGIVADSVPSLEFDETVNKAKALMKAVELAESGRDAFV